MDDPSRGTPRGDGTGRAAAPPVMSDDTFPPADRPAAHLLAAPPPTRPASARSVAPTRDRRSGRAYGTAVRPARAGPRVPRAGADPAAEDSPVVSTGTSALRKATREQDQFLMLVAHELKSPITALKGSVQLISRRLRGRGLLDEAARLDTAARQIDRLTALVDYLLGAGLNSRTIDLHPVSCNLADLIREMADAMASLGPDHELVVDAPAAGLMVEADPDRIAQILRNLIANAIKYSPLGGDIEITLLPAAGATAEVRVRDHGMGIPAADRELVFERFHRGSNVGRIAGFGLGLSVSREIAEAHHGRLWVGEIPEAAEVAEAPGCLLCLELPLTQPTGPEAAGAP